ncbi:MAG: beta-propeller domain-containing protein [Candidatus Bathyarchaeota archaeon]|nr:MAG: beta-propeller domain-containing protein [Candidatus Bathyarchaeota archaeon]
MQREIKRKTVSYGIAAVVLAVLLTTVIFEFGIQPYFLAGPLRLETFSSHDELESFLRTNMEQAANLGIQYDSFLRWGGEVAMLDAETAPAHSTTNIQVAGVDEADIVKAYGEYLYVVSGNDVHILRGYPPQEAEELSKITLDETYNIQIYVNGDRLAILGGHFAPIRNAYMYTGEAFLRIYDISDRTSPLLARSISLNGTLSGSRKIGDYIYAVVNQLAMKPDYNKTIFEVALPTIYSDDATREIQATEIKYVNITDTLYYFTTVVATNIIDDVQEPTCETILTGSTACIYVSQSNIYLTVPNTNAWILFAEVRGRHDETLIYRIRLDEDDVICEAEGAVSGYVLNQFSMDEYNDFFRIATTEWTHDGSRNNLYVLNMSLSIVGELPGLAPDERIYSARFMGDRCYLVTFRQVDPFFVIDLAEPTEPEVLGDLKIPGFSGYLHPYDEDHIIGVGKQDNNLKLSLFDVTNVSKPTEAVPPFIASGWWSDSTVLTDHKAFLFARSKQLLALPVSINHVEIKDGETHTNRYWQGAYVFNISLEEGFVLRGNITHHDNDMSYFEYGYQVQRILYIEDVLFTISEAKVKMNDMETLQLLNEVEF